MREGAIRLQLPFLPISDLNGQMYPAPPASLKSQYILYNNFIILYFFSSFFLFLCWNMKGASFYLLGVRCQISEVRFQVQEVRCEMCV